MLLVCKNHIKQGLQYLDAPHIVSIKEKNLKCCCVFCNERAEFKFFYSIPISRRNRINIQEMIKQHELEEQKKDLNQYKEKIL